MSRCGDILVSRKNVLVLDLDVLSLVSVLAYNISSLDDLEKCLEVSLFTQLFLFRQL